MFAPRYFAPTYFAPRYFPPGSLIIPIRVVAAPPEDLRTERERRDLRDLQNIVQLILERLK